MSIDRAHRSFASRRSMRAGLPTLFGCARGADAPIVCLGAAYDRGSPPRCAGAADAPSALRRASGPELVRVREGSLYDLRNGTKLFDGSSLSDLGDIRFKTGQSDSSYCELLLRAVELLAEAGKRMLILGGDHSITLSAIRGFARAGVRLQIVHLDAHHDYEDIAPDECPTHASFIGHIMAEGLVDHVFQIGVRGLSWGFPSPIDGVEAVPIGELAETLLPKVPVYLSIDADAFDPALVPAVHFPEPGGLTLTDLDAVLDAIEGAALPLLACDWTEFVPALDAPNNMAARTLLAGIARTISALERGL